MVCVVFIETHTKKIANGKKSVVSLKMRDKFSFFIRSGESYAVCENYLEFMMYVLSLKCFLEAPEV